MTRPMLQMPVHLVLDFDSTLTKQDTIALMSEIPLQRNKRLGYDIHRRPNHDLQAVPEFSSLESFYMQDYERHLKAETPLDQSLSFLEQAKAYSARLAARRTLEERSMKRLEKLGFFLGVKRADVVAAADALVKNGRLELRDGWSELMQMFVQSPAQSTSLQESKVSILSLNWSETFIRQALLAALEHHSDEMQDLRRFLIENLNIQASEIAGLDDPEGSNGQMHLGVLSSADKLQRLPSSHQKAHQLFPQRQPDHTAPYLVYVGDSSTDFDCLMAADTGIWLCPAADTAQAQERCQRTFRPLTLGLEDIETAWQSADGLTWAQGFDQIIRFLSKLSD